MFISQDSPTSHGWLERKPEHLTRQEPQASIAATHSCIWKCLAHSDGVYPTASATGSHVPGCLPLGSKHPLLQLWSDALSLSPCKATLPGWLGLQTNFQLWSHTLWHPGYSLVVKRCNKPSCRKFNRLKNPIVQLFKTLTLWLVHGGWERDFGGD